MMVWIGVHKMRINEFLNGKDTTGMKGKDIQIAFRPPESERVDINKLKNISMLRKNDTVFIGKAI